MTIATKKVELWKKLVSGKNPEKMDVLKILIRNAFR
jgi:hypothetical protein